MGRVEGALSDETNGIASGLTGLFTTADLLTADPANTTMRSQFHQEADNVASGFSTATGQLSEQANGVAGPAMSENQRFLSKPLAVVKVHKRQRLALPGSTTHTRPDD